MSATRARRGAPDPAEEGPPRVADPRRRKQLAVVLLAIFVAAGVVISVTGFSLQQDEERRTKRAVAAQLQAIGTAKVERVTQWREERLADAASIREDVDRARAVRGWLSRGRPEAGRAAQLTWLGSFRRHTEYRSIVLVGTDGVQILPPPSGERLRGEARGVLSDAIRTGRPVMSEFVRREASVEPRIFVATPLIDEAGIVGGVIFEVDTAADLQLLVSRWPIPTHSGESILVEASRGGVVFLTSPRARTHTVADTPVSLRAARGEIGFLEGTDYLGHEVLAFASRVPSTRWAVVTKIDTSEAVEAARRNAWQVFAIALAMLLALGSSSILFWERDRVGELQRKLHEQHLRSALEERLNFVSRGISDAVLLASLDGPLLDANDRAVNLLAFPLERLLTLTPNDFWADPAQRKPFVEAIESDGYAFREAELRRGDGTTFPAELTAQMLEGEGGLMQVIIRDVSERKEAERKLLRANRLYAVLSSVSTATLRSRSMSELFAEGARIAVTEGDFCLACVGTLDAAKSTVSVLAFTPGRGATDGVSFTLDDVSGRESTLGRAIAAGELVWNNDLSDAAPDHAWLADEIRAAARSAAAVPLRRSGTVIGALGIYSAETGFFTPEELRLVDEVGRVLSFALDRFDADERRRSAEQALLVNEERLRLTLEATNDAMWDMDWGRGTFYMSPRYYTMLGYAPGEFPATFDHFVQLLHPAEAERVLHELSAMWSDGDDAWRSTFRMRARDGSYRLLSARGRIVEREPDGRARRVVGTHTDITETRALEEALRHAQKMEAVGRLAGGVAHDFNNILQAILSMLHVLRVRHEDRNAWQSRIDDLLALVHRGAGLTRQLLLFARREVHDLVRADLNEVVARSTKMLEHLLRENIRLDVRLAPEPLWVIVDVGQIEQVLMNLVVNASDSMPGGGRIVLRTFGGAGSYGLEVEDAGSGIPEELKGKVFEPFFTTKEAGKGTGLGLSVTHGIVTAHHGTVTFESVPGSTVFRVELPAAGRTVRPEVRTQTPGELPLGKGQRILLAEDEEPTREGLVVLLNLLHYEVVAVESGAEALDRASSGAFDLLMSDLVLPDVHGDALTTAVREKIPDIPVLLMSGYADDDTVRRARSGGRVRFLQKPFELDALARALAELLGQQDED